MSENELQAMLKWEYSKIEKNYSKGDESVGEETIIVIEDQLAKLKKQLEDETFARIDLENENQTLKEDILLKSNVYEKEMNRLRTSKRVEVEQAGMRLRDEYDSRLVRELQRIR